MSPCLRIAAFLVLAPTLAFAQPEEDAGLPLPTPASDAIATEEDVSEDEFGVMNLRMLKAMSARPRATWEGLDPYRRASDGTVNWQAVKGDWKKLVKRGSITEANGLLNFGLALFLKEIALVAETGDRARINDFVDGLLTTDFYTHYGLFVAGARIGEVGYTALLQRWVKPAFVSNLLKTNLVLAVGMAVPQLVAGRFEGKAFAISLGSLGLSYRRFLFRGLRGEEATFAGRLERLGHDAATTAGTRTAAVTRISKFNSLRSTLERSYGSIEKYAEHLVSESENKLSRALGTALESYKHNREALLCELYEGNRRDTPLLAGNENAEALADAVANTSTNRLEAYDDEAAIIAAARKTLLSGGRSDLSGALDSATATVAGEKALDERLYRGRKDD